MMINHLSRPTLILLAAQGWLRQVAGGPLLEYPGNSANLGSEVSCIQFRIVLRDGEDLTSRTPFVSPPSLSSSVYMSFVACFSTLELAVHPCVGVYSQSYSVNLGAEIFRSSFIVTVLLMKLIRWLYSEIAHSLLPRLFSEFNLPFNLLTGM